MNGRDFSEIKETKSNERGLQLTKMLKRQAVNLNLWLNF